MVDYDLDVVIESLSILSARIRDTFRSDEISNVISHSSNRSAKLVVAIYANLIEVCDALDKERACLEAEKKSKQETLIV